MAEVKSVFVYVFILALTVSTALAVKCYCNDKTDSDCNKGECDGGICLKEAAVIDGKPRVWQNCQAYGVPGCLKSMVRGDPDGVQCLCNTPYCNSSSTLKLSILSILFTVLAVICIR